MKLLNVSLISLTLSAIASASGSLKEQFSSLKSNKEVVQLVAKSLAKKSSKDVVKAAITGSKADEGLVRAIVATATLVKPQDEKIIKLTAYLQSSEMLIKFGGASQGKNEGKVLYSVYGDIIGRAIRSGKDQYAVYNEKGKKMGVLKRATETQALTTDLAIDQGASWSYEGDASLFAGTFYEAQSDGSIKIALSANGQFIPAQTSSEFTAEVLSIGGENGLEVANLSNSELIETYFSNFTFDFDSSAPATARAAFGETPNLDYTAN